jgi:thiamine monophosphate synthase
LALGGIDETNYESVLKVADGFAAIRFLNNAENLRKLAEKMSRKDAKLAKKN